jgi:hypothetical protein
MVKANSGSDQQGMSVERDIDQRVCPLCGGAIIEIHCVAYCTQCHAAIDSCCEGIKPNPGKLSRMESVPCGKSVLRQKPRRAPSSPQTKPSG